MLNHQYEKRKHYTVRFLPVRYYLKHTPNRMKNGKLLLGKTAG